MFIFSYFPVHYESIQWFCSILTRGQGHGKIHHEAASCHLQARFPASEGMQDLLAIFIPIFIPLYYCICSIVPLFLGFSYRVWKSHAPSCPLSFPGVQSRIFITLGRRCTGRTGEAELMCHFCGKACCTKIAYKTHMWERDADKNFSTPVSVIFNFKTFCERCCNSVNKYKTI